MIFLIYDSGGHLRCISRNWPLARAALDTVISDDIGCPRLEVYSDDIFLE